MLDLVEPVPASPNRRATCRDARFKRRSHASLDSRRRLQASLGALVALGTGECLGLLQRLFAGEDLRPQTPAREIVPVKEFGFPASEK